MTSSQYQKNTVEKPSLWRAKKIVILLLMLFGLYLFAIDFPFYKFFEPQSTGWILWVSYANDLIFAFAFYFFLCFGEKWLKTWQIRAFIAFVIPTLFEIGQLLYSQFFMETYASRLGMYIGSFDILDIVVQLIGVGFAVLVEQYIFARFFKNW
jgi:hypothetical protein